MSSRVWYRFSYPASTVNSLFLDKDQGNSASIVMFASIDLFGYQMSAFNSLLRLWKYGQTLRFVFDVLLETYIATRTKGVFEPSCRFCSVQFMKSHKNWNHISSFSFANLISQPHKHTKSHFCSKLKFPLPALFSAQIPNVTAQKKTNSTSNQNYSRPSVHPWQWESWTIM